MERLKWAWVPPGSWWFLKVLIGERCLSEVYLAKWRGVKICLTWLRCSWESGQRASVLIPKNALVSHSLSRWTPVLFSVSELTQGTCSLQGAEILLLLGQIFKHPFPPPNQEVLLPVTRTTLKSSAASATQERSALSQLVSAQLVIALGHIHV